MNQRAVRTCATTALIGLLGLLGAEARPAAAGDYLAAGEVAAIGAGAAGLLLLGDHLKDVGARRPPRWTEPPGFDRWVAEHLAPPPSPRRRNFMQTDTASGVNVVAFGAALGFLDASYPVGERGKDLAQGQFLYYAGLLSLKGVQDAVKGTVARQRPLARLAPEVAARRASVDPGRDQRSFWSGHAASAFYASTYLNKHLRGVLRRRLDGGNYRRWRWAPPALFYAWAGWVAYSRIQAYEHYASDVAAGAVAGWLCAELFYGLDDRGGRRDGGSTKATPLLSFTIYF